MRVEIVNQIASLKDTLLPGISESSQKVSESLALANFRAALGGKAPVEDNDLAQKGQCDGDRQLLQQREMRGGKLPRLRRIAGEAGGGELIGSHRTHLTPTPQWEHL